MKKLLFIVLASGWYVHTSDTALQNVLQSYETALTDLISAYEKEQPPIPLSLESSNMVGATYQKLIDPYISYLSSYARLVIQELAKHFPYQKDLSVLAKEFDSYNQAVKKIVTRFPKEWQQKALDYFYEQIAGTVVEAGATVVQQIAFAGKPTAQDVLAARQGYDIAWASQTKKMKVAGFLSYDAFRSTITEKMVQIYHGAIKQALASFNYAAGHEDTNQKMYSQIADWYGSIAEIYTNYGGSLGQQNSALALQSQKQYQAKVEQFKKAYAQYQEAEEKASAAQGNIVLSLSDVSTVQKEIHSSTVALQAALTSYKEAATLYGQAGDVVGQQLCKSKTMQVEAEQYVRGVQVLWTLFLSNAKQTNIKPFDIIKQWVQEGTKDTETVQQCVQALQALVLLCQKKPNSFSQQLAIAPLLKQVGILYKAAGIQPENQQKGSDKHTVRTDSSGTIVSIDTITNAQIVVQKLIAVLQGLVAVMKLEKPDAVGNQLLQIMTNAKLIDSIMSKDNELQQLIPPFPLLVTGVKDHTYALFVVHMLYHFVVVQANNHIQKAGAGGGKTALYYESLMNALSWYLLLQPYVSYLSSDQQQLVQDNIAKISEEVDIQKQAQKIIVSAASASWAEKKEGTVTHTSLADTLWTKGIQLYGVAVDIASKKGSLGGVSVEKIRVTYITVLQKYIQSYIQHVNGQGKQISLAVPLYRLYIGAKALQNNSIEKWAMEQIELLFGMGEKGWFGQLSEMMKRLKLLQEGSEQQQVEKKMQAWLQEFSQAVLQQQHMIEEMKQWFSSTSSTSQFLEQKKAKEGTDLIAALGTFKAELHVENIIQMEVKSQLATAEQLAQEAEKATAASNFVQAADNYTKAEQLYAALMKNGSAVVDATKMKQEYFLTKTRATAASIVAKVVIEGSEKVGDFTGVPTNYTMTEYAFSVDLKKLALSLPKSLQSLEGKKQESSLSDQQKIDLIHCIRAFIISKMLEEQSLEFTDCYSSITLQKKDGLTGAENTILSSTEQTVNAYVAQFSKVQFSVTISGDTVAIVVKDMPLPISSTLYALYPSVESFYIGAYSLFKPGIKLISFGSASYVPGQDQVATEKIYEDLAYAYLASGEQSFTKAKAGFEKLIKQFAQKPKGKQVDALMKQYAQYKGMVTTAQAAWFAPDQSAHAYFMLAKDEKKAAEVKELYLNAYKEQAELMKQLLVGSPFSESYITVLRDLNIVYLSWSSQLDQTTDAHLIATINNDIISLFTTAGTSCEQYKYTDPMFPKFEQYNYSGAASNYISAQKKYKSLEEPKQAEAMVQKAYKDYFDACNQQINCYFYAKQHGLTYHSEQTDKAIAVSYQDVVHAYDQFSQYGAAIDTNEVHGYNVMKSLLTNAYQYYQFLSQQYSTTGKKPTKKEEAEYQNKIIAYLKQKKAISEKVTTTIPYTEKGVIEAILILAQNGFDYFEKESKSVASQWIQILGVAVAHLYIQDYMGGIQGSTPEEKNKDFEHKWQQFFLVLQKAASSMQNSSSAYIG